MASFSRTSQSESNFLSVVCLFVQIFEPLIVSYVFRCCSFIQRHLLSFFIHWSNSSISSSRTEGTSSSNMGLEGTKRLENQIRHKHQVNQLIYIFCDRLSFYCQYNHDWNLSIQLNCHSYIHHYVSSVTKQITADIFYLIPEYLWLGIICRVLLLLLLLSFVMLVFL